MVTLTNFESNIAQIDINQGIDIPVFLQHSMYRVCQKPCFIVAVQSSCSIRVRMMVVAVVRYGQVLLREERSLP